MDDKLLAHVESQEIICWEIKVSPRNVLVVNDHDDVFLRRPEITVR